MIMGEKTQAQTETITSQFEKTGKWRIGQTYSEGLIERVSRRDDMAFFWTTGVVERSFRDGFKIVDDKDKEPEWATEFHKQQYLDDIIRGVVFERKRGAVTFALFTGPDKITLMPFRKDHVHFEVDELGNLDKFYLEEHIGGGQDPILHEVDGDLLPNIFHEVLRPDKFRYQGISVLEPIWDLLDERRIVYQGAAILTGRVSSGIRVATVESRSDSTEDDAVQSEMETALANLESDDISVVLRRGFTVEGQRWEDTLEIMGGPNFNFLEKVDMVHRGLSVATNIPKNFFDGIFQGSLMGAETVLQMLHAALRKIQDDWTFRLEAIIKRWCELTGKTWANNLKIEWQLKPTLTDQDKATLELTQAQTLATLLASGIISVEEARKDLDLDESAIPIKPADVSIQVDGLDEKEEPEEEEEPKDESTKLV